VPFFVEQNRKKQNSPAVTHNEKREVAAHPGLDSKRRSIGKRAELVGNGGGGHVHLGFLTGFIRRRAFISLVSQYPVGHGREVTT